MAVGDEPTVWVHWTYDPAAHQLVGWAMAAEGEGTVEITRIDADQWSDADKQRMRHARDPDEPLPEPGSSSEVTRRSA